MDRKSLETNSVAKLWGLQQEPPQITPMKFNNMEELIPIDASSEERRLNRFEQQFINETPLTFNDLFQEIDHTESRVDNFMIDSPFQEKSINMPNSEGDDMIK